MPQEKRKKIKRNIHFNETGIKLALSIIEKLEKPLELLFYLMRNVSEKSFVVMLLSAENVDIKNVINTEKRDTDVLLEMEVDGDNAIYAVICQETKVDGGYRFVERVHQVLSLLEAQKIYSVELEVGSSKYSTKEVMFKLVEIYLKAVDDEKDGEIIYHSLH